MPQYTCEGSLLFLNHIDVSCTRQILRVIRSVYRHIYEITYWYYLKKNSVDDMKCAGERPTRL